MRILRKWRLWLFIVPAMLLATYAHAQRDEELATAADGQADSALETVTELAAIESGSGDAEGLAEMAAILESRLLTLDFDVRRVTSEVDVLADSLVATKTGSGTQHVMLMAHMDTVFERGTLDTMPIRLDGTRLYGPGVVDAKGGIAVILHGLEILKDIGWDDYASITVLFNPDEEIGSAGSGPLISTLAKDMDTVLSFEVGGSRARNMAWVLAGTASYVQVTMEITGLSSHAGSNPGKGRNAVIELAHQLLRTKDVAAGIDGAQLNWTNVVSDDAYNKIPDHAVAIADVRITKSGADDALLASLQAKVSEDSIVNGTTTTFSMKMLRPGFNANDAVIEAAELVQRMHREISSREVYYVPMVMGATDAGYAAVSDNVAVVEGLGPWGADYHSPGEYLDVDSLSPTIYQLARVLIELGKM